MATEGNVLTAKVLDKLNALDYNLLELCDKVNEAWKECFGFSEDYVIDVIAKIDFKEDVKVKYFTRLRKENVFNIEDDAIMFPVYTIGCYEWQVAFSVLIDTEEYLMYKLKYVTSIKGLDYDDYEAMINDDEDLYDDFINNPLYDGFIHKEKYQNDFKSRYNDLFDLSSDPIYEAEEIIKEYLEKL